MPYAPSRRDVVAGLVGSVASAASLSLRAQPAGAARIIIGSGPGSAIDTLARRVAEKLQPGYAATVIVENKTGASGQLAVSAVKNAATVFEVKRFAERPGHDKRPTERHP